jgi:hypothetical protein
MSSGNPSNFHLYLSEKLYTLNGHDAALIDDDNR